MSGKISIHQRVQLAGSKLIGTTIAKWRENLETKFEVKWDTGSTGTVKEEDLEIFVARNYSRA